MTTRVSVYLLILVSYVLVVNELVVELDATGVENLNSVQGGRCHVVRLRQDTHVEVTYYAHFCLWTWPHDKTKTINSTPSSDTQESTHKAWDSASQVVLSRMLLTLRSTRRTNHGASCLMWAMFAWSVKPLRPGIVEIRRSTVSKLRSCTIRAPPPPHSIVFIPPPQ